MRVFVFRVFGLPVAQARPRAFVLHGHASVYDPKTSRSWKETVRAQAIDAWRPCGESAWSGAIQLDLVFFLPRPKTLPKRVTYHTKRPDLDNLVKPIKDALRGLVYLDDSQVNLLKARKLYASAADPSGVRVVVERSKSEASG